MKQFLSADAAILTAVANFRAVRNPDASQQVMLDLLEVVTARSVVGNEVGLYLRDLRASYFQWRRRTIRRDLGIPVQQIRRKGLQRLSFQ
jgi:hypothetical protein